MNYGSTPQIKQPEYLTFSIGCRGGLAPEGAVLETVTVTSARSGT
jgi:hypothetical protein